MSLASSAAPDFFLDSLQASCDALASFRLCSRSQPQSSPWDPTSEARASAPSPRPGRYVWSFLPFGRSKVFCQRSVGINSKLQFEIMPGALFGLFEINSDTGEVVTTTTLDREVQEVLTLQVLVRDGGAPALSGTTTILCTVGDENDHAPEIIVPRHDIDHAPEIIVPRHDIEVLENQEPGLVYTVLASDMDAGNNGAVRYHIIGKYYLYLNPPLPRIPTRLTHTSWNAFSIWYLVQCLQNSHLLRTDWCPGSPLLLPTATLIQCPPNSSKICP
ncbi:hypothetical protein J1605_010184 [Eschrichtius robustus]|uniref:Cadherin domain-containing protein n=1 Tax=Eschrichtius robustus TaxID=9764 RepID=A0AB34GSL5_ESCRO|nr:hypothetical protein J1605_010184 [Eschrichtius robustus]